MAEIKITGETVTVALSRWEKLGSLHEDVSIPRDQISGAHVAQDLWDELRGVRSPGTGVPNHIMLGTSRHHGAKDFCAVYAHAPGVVIDLRDHEFDRVLVTVEQHKIPDLIKGLTD